MFRRIAATSDFPVDATLNNIDIDRAKQLFNLHPSEVSALLEMAWEFSNQSGYSRS